MIARLSWLLLSAVTIAMAQDGYNLYKDTQRGKAEELDRFITDENYQIDHTALTWPSAGARLQVSNSAKRTMNQFKNLKIQQSGDDEEESEDELEASVDKEGDEENAGTRILIPRTHVLLREDSLKSKRGALLHSGDQLRQSARSAKQALHRDVYWTLKADTSFAPFVFSFVRCNVMKGRFREYFQCG